MEPVKIGFIGLGYWGKNLFRSFNSLPGVDIKTASDLSEENLAFAKTLNPQCHLTQDCNEIFKDPAIQGVVVATPPVTHVDLAEQSFKAGKHTFVEKPLALDLARAEKLLKLSKESDRLLMVGHLLKHHPATHYIKDLIDAGDLGDLYYIYTQRVNLGVIRSNENPLWSLSPHDISLILYFFGQEPCSVQGQGGTYLQTSKQIEDVVFASISFSSGQLAHMQMSWLDPHKIRKLTLVGSQKMAVFDDMEPREKLRIYNKRVEAQSNHQGPMDYYSLREGDIHIPRIEAREPLKLECQNFIDSITGKAQCYSDGDEAVRILRVITALDRSLKSGGEKNRPINLPKE